MDQNCQPAQGISSVTPLSYRPVCILGCGLIGGSLLRALVGRGVPAYGWNRSLGTVEQATADGVDVSADLDAVLRRAAVEGALLVVAVPLFAVPPLLERIAAVAPLCPLTDVISVKAQVYAAVEQAGLGDVFVGSHPMAGSEFSGWEHTDPELFVGAMWVIMAEGEPAVTQRVVEVAQVVGARIEWTNPVAHDAAVACISHVPHLVAEAVACAGAADEVGGGEVALQLSAGSFRDVTRVAGSAPELVRAMCEGNREAVLPVLREVIRLLVCCEEELEQEGTCRGLVEEGFAAHARYLEMMRELGR